MGPTQHEAPFLTKADSSYGNARMFSWRLHGLESASTEESRTVENAISYFEGYFSRPPLKILADELLRTEAPLKICSTVLSAYDQFLAILDNKDARTELETIPRELAERSSVFQGIRQLSHEFRHGLLDWLHMPETPLYALVKQYALF